MAKINFYANSTIGFDGDANLTINSAKTKATLEFEGFGKIQLFGDGLKGTAEDTLKAGTVDKIVFVNVGNDQFMVATGHYNAADVAGETDAVAKILLSLFGGNDTIIGTNLFDLLMYGGVGRDTIFGKGGADFITGGRGDDIMSGGADTDTFYFYGRDGAGRDIITDFDTTGEDADVFNFTNVDIDRPIKAGGGDDTRLILDNGATILLQDVTKAEFLDYLAMQP